MPLSHPLTHFELVRVISLTFILQHTLSSVLLFMSPIVHRFCLLVLTSKVKQEMGVPTHHGPTMQPECLMCKHVCMCVHSAVPCMRDKEVVCVCVSGFLIVGGLSTGAGIFPPVQCFVGGALAGLSSKK